MIFALNKVVFFKLSYENSEYLTTGVQYFDSQLK